MEHSPWSTVPGAQSLEQSPRRTVLGAKSLVHGPVLRKVPWSTVLVKYLYENLMALKRAGCCLEKPKRSYGRSTARYQYLEWYHMTIHTHGYAPELGQLLQTQQDSGQSQPSSRCCLPRLFPRPLFLLRECGTGPQVQFPCLDLLTFCNRMKHSYTNPSFIPSG